MESVAAVILFARAALAHTDSRAERCERHADDGTRFSPRGGDTDTIPTPTA